MRLAQIGNLNTCGRRGEPCLVVVKKKIAAIKCIQAFVECLSYTSIVDNCYSEAVATSLQILEKVSYRNFPDFFPTCV